MDNKRHGIGGTTGEMPSRFEQSRSETWQENSKAGTETSAILFPQTEGKVDHVEGQEHRRPILARRGVIALPDFFIVGHPKCATTSLYSSLAGHPQIYAPAMKEPHFFSSELRRFQQPINPPEPETFADYSALFAGAREDQLRFEASTSYLFSEEAASNIKAIVPDAKIVAVLREPVAFLHSWHQQMVRAGFETERSLRRAMRLEKVREAGKRIPASNPRPAVLQYSKWIEYVTQIQRYETQFGRNRLLILVYDDLINKPTETLDRVLEFIGVAVLPTLELPKLNVSTISMRSRHLADLGAVLSADSVVARTFRKIVKKNMPPNRIAALTDVYWNRLAFRAMPEVKPRIAGELRRRFRPQVEAISDYLDRDLLSEWGYRSG